MNNFDLLIDFAFQIKPFAYQIQPFFSIKFDHFLKFGDDKRSQYMVVFDNNFFKKNGFFFKIFSSQVSHSKLDLLQIDFNLLQKKLTIHKSKCNQSIKMNSTILNLFVEFDLLMIEFYLKKVETYLKIVKF